MRQRVVVEYLDIADRSAMSVNKLLLPAHIWAGSEPIIVR